MCGFVGDEHDWAVEYAEMCHDFGINANVGANLEQFAKLVDDKGGQADLQGAALVNLINDLKVQPTCAEKRRRIIRRRSTWRPISGNFLLLRRFSMFLRNLFSSAEVAYQAFINKPIGRLSKGEFVEAGAKLGFDGDLQTVFRLLALGSELIVKKNFKWVWKLLDPEEMVLARMESRGNAPCSRGQGSVSELSASTPTSHTSQATADNISASADSADEAGQLSDEGLRNEVIQWGAGLESTRDNLIATIFRWLDGRSAGHWSSTELRSFAEILGFFCLAEEWAVEFKEVCSEEGWDEEIGPNQCQVALLVSQKDGHAFCSDQSLNSIVRLLLLDGVSGSPSDLVLASWRPRKRTKVIIDQKPRQELIVELFAALDFDQDAHLDFDELRRYVELSGFSGNGDEWLVEYAKLCAEYKCQVKEGMNLEEFAKLVESSPSNDYLENNRLREFIATITSAAPNFSTLRARAWATRPTKCKLRSQEDRRSLIRVLFQTLDTKREGQLGPDELRRYAEMCGFVGDEHDWAVEYAEMCHDFGINANVGANLEQFAKLVDDKGGQADLQGAALVNLINDLKVQPTCAEKRRRIIRRRSTWRPISGNFLLLRRFSMFLRNLFSSAEVAYQAFINKPIGRLSKGEFVEAGAKLGFDGDLQTVFRLLALGSELIVKKNFKWVWKLLDPEEMVLARMESRGNAPCSRGQGSVSELSASTPTSHTNQATADIVQRMANVSFR